MTAKFLSSGDLIVDRRTQYAQMLAEAGDFVAAADVMEQALAGAPRWAAGWMRVAEYHERAGTEAQAIAAWRTAAELDPGGTLGAQTHLAAYGEGDVAPAIHAAYVGALFDHYADHFEQSLLKKLDYAVPDRLAALIVGTMERLEIAGFARAVDLGCGTGLMGARLREHVGHLAGVDLSAAMVAEVRRKGTYDAAEQGDLLDTLAQSHGALDLVTAADVFIYCAALPPIFAAIHQALRAGGVLAFSVERHQGPEAQVLQPSLRYAHNGAATARELTAQGFEIIEIAEQTIRMDRGQPIEGLLFVARKPVTGATDAPAELAS